jgi:hypothetical protein
MLSASRIINVMGQVVRKAYAIQGRSVPAWEVLRLGTVPATGAHAVSVSVSCILNCVLVSSQKVPRLQVTC